MVKVIAKERGYYGGVVREPNEVFPFSGPGKMPKWVEPVGGSGQDDTAVQPPAEPPATPPAPTADDGLPEGWKGFNAEDMKALAKSITGQDYETKADAKAALDQHVEGTAPGPAPSAEPFADAPDPETVKPQGNGVVEALGGPQPDWLPEGANGTEGEGDDKSPDASSDNTPVMADE